MTKYKKWYDILIQVYKEKDFKKKRGTNAFYYEKHHILPKSLGGTEEKNNLVILTAKAHFVAHHLLFKHYNIIGNVKEKHYMALAFKFMKSKNKKHKDIKSLTITAKTYEQLKIAISVGMTGKGNPAYGKQSIRKGKKYPVTIAQEKAYSNRRKFNIEYIWVHKKQDTQTCTIYELQKIDNSIDTMKLRDIINKSTSRRTHNGWSLQGVDIRSKLKRDKDKEVYTIYTFANGAETKTIGEFLTKYPQLERNHFLVMLKRVNTNKEYKGFMLLHTYKNRIVTHNMYNVTIYTWVNEITKEKYINTYNSFCDRYKLEKGKVAELLSQKDSTRNKYKGWKIWH